MDKAIYVLSFVASAGALGIAHFALHPEVIGAKLSRVSAYMIGVGTIGIVTTVLGELYATSARDVLILFWLSVGGATAATVGGRLLRFYVDGRFAIQERDELMRKTRGDA